ncbi:MAG: FHA domain-containing protein, partial [Planctomycetota bacterium]|nr:FHA domain-containing protein [Planctomycetota bacterium]
MAKLTFTDDKGSQEYELKGDISTFGRSADNSCLLRDRELSRQHFQIERTEHGFKVVDRESRNGTRVNDNFVNQHILRPGDQIQIGKLVLTFHDTSSGSIPIAKKEKGSDNTTTPPRTKETESRILNSQFGSASAEKPTRPSQSRSRSGGTTAIYRVRPSQRGTGRGKGSGSKNILTGIFAVMGLFLGLIVVILIIGSAKNETDPGNKPPPTWEDTSEQPDPNEIAHMSDIRERLKKEEYSAAVQLVEAFLKKYPESDNLKFVRKYRKEAEEKLNSKVWRKFHNLESRAQVLRQENKFVEAIRMISAGLENPELAPYQSKLTVLKNELILSGKVYYKTQIVKGEALIDERNFPG